MGLIERLMAAVDNQYIQENVDEVIELLCDAAAEIEHLQGRYELAVKERETQYKSYFYTVNQLNEANAEIERLREELSIVSSQNSEMYGAMKSAKAEAVKEFAEYLVDHSDGGINAGDIPDLYVEFMGGIENA